MDDTNLSFNQILDKLPDYIFWPIMEGIEEQLSIDDNELDNLINELMQDASAKISAEDDK